MFTSRQVLSARGPRQQPHGSAVASVTEPVISRAMAIDDLMSWQASSRFPGGSASDSDADRTGVSHEGPVGLWTYERAVGDAVSSITAKTAKTPALIGKSLWSGDIQLNEAPFGSNRHLHDYQRFTSLWLACV